MFLLGIVIVLCSANLTDPSVFRHCHAIATPSLLLQASNREVVQ